MVDITWTLVIQIISFLLFFLAFRRIFITPVMRTMERREENITALLEAAEERREESVELQERISDRLREAKSEASRVVEEAEEEARRRYEAIVSEAREEGDRVLAEARSTIEEERTRALESFHRDAVDLAQIISEKVLTRQLDEKERHVLEEQLERRLEQSRR